MRKIKVTNPIVELDGDEMARIMWHLIKEELITPFLDLGIDYFDLSIQNREKTEDRITQNAALAILKNDVGIKCATITADESRVREFKLSKKWPSPNGTIRNLLDGTVFREPILIDSIPRLVPGWKTPFIIGRHAYGDQYKASEMRVEEAGTLTMIFKSKDGKTETVHVHDFKGPGVSMAMHNTDESIYAFARSCFNMALEKNMPLYLSTKNTILNIYDGNFKNIFEKVYEHEFKKDFILKKLFYRHELIDNMVAIALRNSGGFVWACKNYDGDVQSDAAAQGYGSLGLMKSILTTPNGKIVLSEAAHGTVTAHYRRKQHFKELNWVDDTSTNPTASIFAWTGGLRHRAKLDNNQELHDFCMTLEDTVISTIKAGNFTRDIAKLVYEKDKPERSKWLTTEEFINNVKEGVKERLLTIS